MKILLTGATGFIGKGLLPLLLEQGHDVRVAVREEVVFDAPVDVVIVGNLSGKTAWRDAAADCDAVIHLAGLAHILNKAEAANHQPFFDVNRDAAIALARAAARADVKQFIFMSSIGVHGTQSDVPLTETSPIAPVTPYGESKAEAEKDLRALCAEHEMALTIIRPPLVYGAGVKGNFERLIKLVKTGLPLPLGLAKQPRSMVSRDNLNHFIMHCLGREAAYNQAFVVADAEQTSTQKLVRRMGKIMGKRLWLLPVPVALMKALLYKLGRKSMADGLFAKLVIDTGYAQKQLGWQAPYSQPDELKKALQEHTHA